ncbi:NAD(P)-dependent oxidoreductase [Micromonospora sp. NPDC049230]|uniref:NAD-dependent epimerase/dehydratase family protein n=1 Tax=Micromonospora sp. NPDC049230 TaxID=3155502 RepID=UPI0033C521F7
MNEVDGMTGTVGQVTITGITGLIGRSLCEVLTRRGVPYRGLARTPERARTVVGAQAVVAGSIADPAALTEACEGSAAVVHLARSSHDLADLCRYDYPALHAVIAAVNANRAELHFASSQAVFGDAPDPPPLLDDDSPPNPTTAYGAMKAAWERTARAACTTPPVVYRLPIVVPDRLADGAPWLRELLGTGFCHLTPDGTTLVLRPADARFARAGVSFVHVDDVAETIAANLFRAEARGTVAMLADPEYVRFRELAELFAGLARDRGLTVRDEWPDPANGAELTGAMFRFDPTRAAKCLGFASPNGPERLLAKAAKWFTATLDARATV